MAMRTIKISKDKFTELCGYGQVNFTNHNVFRIHWLTYFKKIAIAQDVRTEQLELIELEIE